MLKPPLNETSLRELFTKAYGADGPSREQWKDVYTEDETGS